MNSSKISNVQIQSKMANNKDNNESNDDDDNDIIESLTHLYPPLISREMQNLNHQNCQT